MTSFQNCHTEVVSVPCYRPLPEKVCLFATCYHSAAVLNLDNESHRRPPHQSWWCHSKRFNHLLLHMSTRYSSRFMSMALIIGRLAVNSQTIKHGAMNNTNTIGNRTQQSRCLMRPYHLGPVMLLDTPINHYAQERSIQQQRSVPDNPQWYCIQNKKRDILADFGRKCSSNYNTQ